MVTKKQLEEALIVLMTKVDTINERTKKHTLEIKELRKQLNLLK